MRERIRGLIGVAALATIAMFSWPAVSAGSVAGEPITAEFNYVALFVGTTIAGDIDDFIHKPGDGDPVTVAGEYTDAEGNFEIPSDGLVFPRITVDLDRFELYGEIALAGEGSGNYDRSTGEMKLDLDLALTLAVDDLEALSNEVGIPLGTGELACRLSPLETSLSTDGTWPHPGKAYENKDDLIDGALAGNWRKKPAATVVKGEQDTCNLIVGFLRPVGGLWLVNSTENIDELPGWDMGKCPPPGAVQFQLSCIEPKCPEGQVGFPPDCKVPVCPEGRTGTYPDCDVIVDPPEFCLVRAVGLNGKARLRAGKKMKVRLIVKNVGTIACRGKVALRSSNRQVKIPKRIALTVPAGKTATRTITVRTTRRARGKATISASYAGKKAITRLSIRKK